MKTLLSIGAMLGVLLYPAVAQQPLPGLQLQAVTGTAPVLVGSIAGSAGTATAYYCLVANFVGGSIPSNVVQVNNVPNTLNSTNYVSFIWTPVAGVTSYDLLKLTNAALPSGSTSVGLHTALAVTATSSVDQGTSTASYTLAAPPINGVLSIIFNSRDHVYPNLEIDAPTGATGLGTGFAINGKVVNTPNLTRLKVDATATGVTLAAASMIHGVYLHAPTGAVNDTTDTAANIIALLPQCYIGAGNGAETAIDFTLINNSAGANTITVLAGTGVTLASSVSPLTVAQNKVQRLIGYITSCSTPAITLYSVGNGLTY